MSVSKTWILPSIVAAIAAVIVAALGATITDLGPWYQSLEKPSWNPPDVAFPLGWTVIFALNTAAIVSAWRAAPSVKVADTIIGLFALNAFLNITWSMLFFRVQRPDWAFVEVLLLLLSIVALLVYSARRVNGARYRPARPQSRAARAALRQRPNRAAERGRTASTR